MIHTATYSAAKTETSDFSLLPSCIHFGRFVSLNFGILFTSSEIIQESGHTIIWSTLKSSPKSLPASVGSTPDHDLQLDCYPIFICYQLLLFCYCFLLSLSPRIKCQMSNHAISCNIISSPRR